MAKTVNSDLNITGGVTSDFNIFTPRTGVSYIEGQLFYDNDEQALSFHNADSNNTLQIGQENWIRVRNDSGSLITNGSAVYINGAQGGANLLPTIALARANSVSTSNTYVGLVTSDLANGTDGYVTTFGLVRNFDTSAFNNGDEVWLSSSVAGELTNIRPQQPNYTVPVGFISRSHATLGVVMVTSNPIKFGAFSQNYISFGDSDGFLMQDSNFQWNQGTSLLTIIGNATVTDEAYGISWDGSTQVPTKNAIYDKIESLGGGGGDDVSTFTEKTGNLVGTDRLVGNSGGTDFLETINQIPLSIFNNDSGWTSNVGDMLLGTSQTVTAAKFFNHSTFNVRNPGNTFSYNFFGSAITTDRIVSLPLLTGNDTLVFDIHPATLSNKTLASPVLNGTITGTGVASVATASTLALRDSNANIRFNNIRHGYTTTATAAGTTTLTVASTYLQFFTGSTTQNVDLPVTSTLVLGHQFYIRNNSTGAVTIRSSGGNTVRVLAGGTRCLVTCILASGTTAASWSVMYMGINITDNKLLSVTNSLTFSGTDATTMTFPSTSGTVTTLAATQTLTNKTVTLGNNTISGTRAQFDTAITDGSFAYQDQTLVVGDHGTASTDQVVNVCYGTSATPPTASTTTEGTLYIQYTA